MKKILVSVVTASVCALTVLAGGVTAPSYAEPGPVNIRSAPYHLYAHGFLSGDLVGYTATDRGPIRPLRKAQSGFASWPKAVSPDGTQLVVAAGAPAQLRIYAIAEDGTLRLQKTQPIPDVPVDVTFAANSRTLYLTHGAASAFVQPYRLSPSGSAVPIGGRAHLGEGSDSMITSTVSIDGRNLYVASWLRGELVRRDILSNGALGPVRQRIKTGIQPLFPRVTPNGKHLVVVSELGGKVYSYNIAENGDLVPAPGGPRASGLLPHVGSVTPDSRYYYVPNQGSTFVSAYRINDDGSLTQLPNAPFGNGPLGAMAEATALSPSGAALYAVGTDNLAMGGMIMKRYWVGSNGALRADPYTTIRTGTVASSGTALTMAPGR